MKPIQTLATALALSTALSTSVMAATKVGVIGAANPQVFAVSEDGSERKLNVGDAIYLNDQLRTTGKGSAQLMFLDKSALTISPDSLVTIDKFVYDPAVKDGAMTLNGAKGAFRFIGGALTKKKAVNIKTPVSTIGIRGGIVDTHISAGGETDAVFLFGKEMTMTNGAGQTTSTTSFGSGLGLADAGAAPVSLPQNVVATRMNNSPTQAAERTAPPANPETLNKIDSKIEASGGTATKAADSTATPPANNDGGGNSPSSDGDGGNDNGGNSNGNGNDNGGGGDNNASADPKSTNDGGAPKQENANASDGAPAANSENGGPAPKQADAGGPAPAAPVAGTEGGAPAPAAPEGFAAGSGLKALPQTDVQIDVSSATGGSNAQETLRADINTAVRGPANAETTNRQTRLSSLEKALSESNVPTKRAETIRKPEEPVTATNTPEPPRTEEPVVNEPPIADNTTTDATTDTTTATNNPPSVTNPAPHAPNVDFATQGESAFIQNGNFKYFTVADLRNGVTDDDAFIVDKESFNVVSGNAVFEKETSGSTLQGAKLKVFDVAAGQTENIVFTYDVVDAEGARSTRTMTVSINGEDFFGNTSTFGATGPATVPTQFSSGNTMRGRFIQREDSGSAASTSDDLMEAGVIKAFTGDSANGDPMRYHGRNVFIMETKQYHNNGGSYDSSAISASGSSSDYVIGAVKTINTADTMINLTDHDVRFEDQNGRVRVDYADAFSGWGYKTTHGALNYYQMQFTDPGADATLTSDDETSYVRTFLMQSPMHNLYDEDSNTVINVSDAYAIYEDMLDESFAGASTPNGIIEYDLLPQLNVDMDSGGADEFGRFDYNHIADLDSQFGNARNSSGLFVDWRNRQFMGGYVNFQSDNGAPTIQTMFGKVKNGYDAITGFDSANNMASGEALEGVYYEMDQGADFSTSYRSKYGIAVDVNDLASTQNTQDGVNGVPVEGFVIQAHHHTDGLVAEQGAVIGDGVTSANVTDITAGKHYDGFSAGLITDNGGYVSRIKTAGITGVHVDTLSDGTVGATVSYHEVDTVGSFSSSTNHTLDFGAFANTGTASAALQDDLYAAEIKQDAGPGDMTKGAFVSMHEAISPSADGNLVCSSCDFAHWGVWQADHESSGNAVQKTALVPYVAGQITTDAELAALAGTSPGVVTYNGQAAANIAIYDNVSNVQVFNEIGSMTANVDLTNRSIAASGLNISFTDIGNGTQDLAIRNNGAIDFSASNHFSHGVQTNFTDSNNVSTGFTADGGASGNINGAFFGSNAEEMGGNYYVHGTTIGEASSSDETVKAGGIYLGKR